VEIAYPEKAGTNNSQIITKTKRMDNSHKRVSDSINPEVLKNGGSVQIDLQAVLADCLGQVDLLEELVRLFKQNALEFIGQLKLHLQNLDFEGIRFASHKIKSGLRMMNSHELLAIAEQIEAESKTDRDLKHLNFLFNCFVNEYPEVEKAIDRQLEKLK
jgi:HPt (histidine-containing phosphotransfer) domain-containing protein